MIGEPHSQPGLSPEAKAFLYAFEREGIVSALRTLMSIARDINDLEILAKEFDNEKITQSP